MDLQEKILHFDKSNWQPVKFGDVVREVRDSINNTDLEGIELEHIVGLEHIDSENIHLRRSASIEEDSTFTKIFRKGQVLFGRRRAYLKKAAQAPFSGICSGDITVMEAKEGLLPDLLPFLVNNDKFFDYAVKHSAGGLSPRTKFKDIAKYEFLLPSKDQQKQLAKLLWANDEMIEKENKVLKKIEHLFLSTSKEIFTGSNGTEKHLDEVADLIMGQSPPGKSYNESGNGMAFLQGNAEFGERYPNHIKYTTEPKKIAPEKSILFSVRAPVGDLNIANQRYCIGRGLAAIVVQNSLLRVYIYNFLRFSKYVLDRNSTGSTFKAVNKDVLASLKLIIPSEDILKSSVERLVAITGNKKNFLDKQESSRILLRSVISQVF